MPTIRRLPDTLVNRIAAGEVVLPRATGADDPNAAIYADAKARILDAGLALHEIPSPGRIERDGPEADAAWAASTRFARRCYLGDGPGSGSDVPTSGLPAAFEGVEPDDAQLVPARENFALLRITLTAFDWLYLAHTGHVRAQFARAATGDWEGRWVSP